MPFHARLLCQTCFNFKFAPIYELALQAPAAGDAASITPPASPLDAQRRGDALLLPFLPLRYDTSLFCRRYLLHSPFHAYILSFLRHC